MICTLDGKACHLAAFFLTSPVNFVNLTITITSHTALNVSDLKIRNKNKNNIKKKLYLSIKCINTAVLTGDTLNRKRSIALEPACSQLPEFVLVSVA